MPDSKQGKKLPYVDMHHEHYTISSKISVVLHALIHGAEQMDEHMAISVAHILEQVEHDFNKVAYYFMQEQDAGRTSSFHLPTVKN